MAGPCTLAANVKGPRGGVVPLAAACWGAPVSGPIDHFIQAQDADRLVQWGG